ncbi:hypothetical protein CkaCkLH20_03872 [Colletotrichum karsti]|uniref:NACHT domain-containing protein n=1 Tax=Colletotrichum karsti TaxID=1095194 RepID=A0A9P6IGI3_9PEZI|nr:uncharacterized protein CkaCkLH20_03872 [Colletotrichum karsti]KAF9878380.1 hypothetical protein CkaCkLH20_03872 [Colletotrichum karsti]
MDPFTALGLAAAIIQFVEFGVKLVSTSREIYISADGRTQEHETLDEICSHLCFLVDDIDDAAELVGELKQRIDEEVALRKLSERCRSTALELQTLLKSLYCTPSGRVASLKQALRAAWGKRKVDDVEARLKEYRQELMAHLVVITSNQQSSVLRELGTLKEATLSMQSNHSGKLEEISAAIQSITYKSSISNESPSGATAFSREDFLQLHEKLLDLTNHARDVSVQQTFLRGLYFRSMPARHRGIAQAHQRTFNWVFGRAGSQRAAAAHVSNFIDWLEVGKGIYWISGKAGSGKSTLMKYLGNHPRTSELLSAWAEPQECIVASHYFWSAGTELQKSIDGLVRSLLYEIFRQMPDLIDNVVLEESGQSEYRFQSGEYGRAWSIFELERIVNHLVDCDKLALRFCFFVDGLDEYDGDHHKLIKILSRLASSPNVKLCVSSRPWNVFEEAYGKSSLWKLALQDLTQDDIRRYTESMLKEHPNWGEYSKAEQFLVKEITKKAQGVFLWVFLVVRSVHEGVTNGDAVSTLQRRVSQLPQDLETFFKHTLKSVNPFYHGQMAQMFYIALQAEEPLNIMLYSLLDYCTQDVSQVLQLSVQPMDKYEVFTRRNQMIRRLDGRSKGLLEIQTDHAASDYLGPRVTFLHRTVRDFLLTKEMAEFLAERLSEFKPSTVIFRAYVALIKLMPVRKEHFQRSGVLSRALEEAFFYAYQAEAESGSSESELVDDLRYVVEDMADSFDAEIPWRPDCFVDFAISRGLAQYLSQHRECNPGARDIVNGAFLREAIMESLKPVNETSPDLTSVVSLFLRRGSNLHQGARVHEFRRETWNDLARASDYTSRMFRSPQVGHHGNNDSHVAGARGAYQFRPKDFLSNTKGSIWGDWLEILSLSMAEYGMDYPWATRQKRILDHLISHDADVNETSTTEARWGKFVDGLLHLSRQPLEKRVSDVYVSMLRELLRHDANCNAPYQGSTISKVFFAKVRGMAAPLNIPELERAALAEGPDDRVDTSLAHLELLAQVATALLQHKAHPSCIMSAAELHQVFPRRLAQPIQDLWESRRAEIAAESGFIRMVLRWAWSPWS